jgi:hypothetical protein
MQAQRLEQQQQQQQQQQQAQAMVPYGQVGSTSSLA